MSDEKNIRIEKLKDGREIHFEKSGYYGAGRTIPRFCTYCGSDNLTSGGIEKWPTDGGIRCNNCGMSIHDCCTQTGYEEYRHFIKEADP